MGRCPKGNGRTKAGFTTDTYRRKGADIVLTVSGIPAEICTVCGEDYVDIETLKEIEQLINPLFAYDQGTHRLPSLKVTIAFNPSAMAVPA
ncbi:type II toxin-antitoxin system MqsA family antitoxin [Candidatus Poribacteria bacterium]|nr:type II toxin-antitoxin system MqsA family antitoxin [Candidatus Poribacteria bacterium]